MKKEQAVEQFKKNWAEMKRVGLVDTMNVFERAEYFIDAAFEWVEEENKREWTLQECIDGVKKHARNMGAEAEINFHFNKDKDERDKI